MTDTDSAPDSGPDGHRCKVLVTTLIALTTFLGAIGAWRSTEAGGAASSAEHKALGDEPVCGVPRCGSRYSSKGTRWLPLK